MPQQIRPSQYITTYGPGAILETADGPRVIPSIAALYDSGGPYAGQASNFEIPERRLDGLLGPMSGIVRVPTNAEVGVPDSREIHPTLSFPSWSICARHNILYQHGSSGRCPTCPNAAPQTLWRRARKEAVRFVVACRAGHMDDVNWHGAVTHRAMNCRPDHYLWIGGGGSLRLVTIRCPRCRGEVNLGTAYARSWTCSGRRPELGIPTNDPTARPGCNLQAEMLQKGAANLRLPQLQAALTIPRLSTRLHRFFSQINVRPALASRPATMAILLQMLQTLQQMGLVSPAAVTFVSQQPWSTVQQAITDVLSPSIPQDERELLEQEFRELQNAAHHGAPPLAAATPGAPPYFEVVRSAVATGLRRRPGGIEFRVAPVSRLRVVLVQRGFKRLNESGTLVSNAFNDTVNRRTWYPGVELFGEGVFIDVDPNGAQLGRLPLQGPHMAAWMAARTNNSPATQGAETHPVYVWWHTLSHRLINALAVDSGYSAASIRERVYVEVDLNGDARGGVLLYTTQPGGDGTLGGLISLVPTFADVLQSALRDDLTCSNDPLCADEQFDISRVNGAACYACLLVSETSCEHRNRWLDRNLLIENLP